MNHLFYQGLTIERALFDIRRGLPVCLKLDDKDYLLWAEEFYQKPTVTLSYEMKIWGEEKTGMLQKEYIIGQENESFMVYASHLLALVKRAELKPALRITNVTDEKLLGCISYLTPDDLTILMPAEFQIERLIETSLPSKYSENMRLFAYRIIPGFYEYYALVFGNIKTDDIIDVRLHAECLTGDLLGSLKCDCGPQLEKALSVFGKQESGILIYLRQEGRNIGLLNKMRAYHLQNQGLDTVDANLALGFHLDERDYGASALILKDLGVSKVRLFTNNPEKIDGLERYGIIVTDRMSHNTQSQKHNENYLATKKNRIGHL